MGGKEDYAPKTNLEPEKSCLEVRIILFQTAMFRFHVSFQRTMYTYMYYTILTIYFPLGKGVGLKACAGKNRLRCIAGSWSPSVDRMRITWAFWTLRLYKLHLGDMGYWDMQVDSLKMIRYWWLCFLFTSWLQRKNHISPLFLRFFPGIVSCCRPSRVFWIHIDNLKEELTFQLSNFSLNFRPCHPQQTCAST